MSQLEKRHLELADAYTFDVRYDEYDDIHVARCLELKDIQAHGDTSSRAVASCVEAVAVALSCLEDDGDEIPEPFGKKKFSGNLTLRMPVDVHREIAIESEKQGVSISKYILSKIS